MKKILLLSFTLILAVAMMISIFQVSANAEQSEKMTTELIKMLDTMSDNDIVEVWVIFNDTTDYSQERQELDRLTNEITQEKYGFTQATIETIEQTNIWKQIRTTLLYQRRHQRELELCDKLGIENDDILGDWDPDNPYKALGSHFAFSKKKILMLIDFDEILSIDSYSHFQEGNTEPPTYEPKSNDSTENTTKGDADKDGSLTILDATHIQRYLAGLIDESEIDLTTSDYNQDGDVTILDATAIQRTLAGLTTET